MAMSSTLAAAEAGGRSSCASTISAPSVSDSMTSCSRTGSRSAGINTVGAGAAALTAAARRESAVRWKPPGWRSASSSTSCGRPAASASARSALRGASSNRSRISAEASWDTLTSAAAEQAAVAAFSDSGVRRRLRRPAARYRSDSVTSSDRRPSDSAARRISITSVSSMASLPSESLG